MSVAPSRVGSAAALLVTAAAAVLLTALAVEYPAVLGGLLLVGVMALSVAGLSALGVFRRLDRTTSRAIGVFFGLKLAMTVISLKASSLVFAGSVDALAYNTRGRNLAAEWSLGLPAPHPSFPGTGGVDLLVAFLYKATLPNVWLAFLLFSWISAVGTLLLWHGASRRWPLENRKQLGLALMFMPSILYWTSPISKEAVVMLGTGLFVLGISYVFDGTKLIVGLLVGAAGVGVIFLVRPNISLLLLVSAAAALVLPWRRAAAERPARAARLMVLALVLVALIPVLAANRQLLHLHPGQGFVQGSLSAVQAENNIGGNSAFQTAAPTSITGVPYAVVSVLLRPFPWEVRSTLMFLSSAESVFLMVWLYRIARRWGRRLVRPRLDGLGTMSAVLLLIFCIIYSSLGNFGLLVRERVTVLPFLLILMTGFERRATSEEDKTADRETAEPASRRDLLEHTR